MGELRQSLRASLSDYAPSSDERTLDIDKIECLYNMWSNPCSTRDEKDFAEKKLIALFLSIYNTNKYCLSNKTNTSVVDSEDLDIIIATTVFKCLVRYRSDGGTEKDNFLRYCIGAIRKELYKEHKISLPFHMPHTSKNTRKQVLNSSKVRAVKLDENGLPMHDKDGNPIYLQRRKIVSSRDGTKYNRTLEGQLIDVETAASMSDSLFEMEDVYDNTNYYGLKAFSIHQTSSTDQEDTMAVNNAVEYDITESYISHKIGNYEDLDSRCWDTKMMNADIRQKLEALPHGDIVIYRWGLDRGYKRTVDQVAQELGVTPKYVNYWSEKTEETFRKKYKEYFKDYFAA